MMERWRTALVDPPWNERGGGKIKRGADRHYALLKTCEIAPVILGSGLWNPEDNAHLYLWTTASHLQDAFEVIDSLGFRYVSNVVWIKHQVGIGQYFRGKHETLLFATRGRGFEARTDRRDLPSALIADHVRDQNRKRVHSAKPEPFYELIEARSKGPFAEFFARRPRDGWTSWGNDPAVARERDEP